MAKCIGVRLAIACLALAGTVERALAQEAVARSLADLVRIVRPGAQVVLIDRDGHEFAGVIAGVTPTDLTLTSHDRARKFREDDIIDIRERRSDSLLNGTLWGLAAGAGAAAGITAIAASANYYVHEERLPTMFAWFGGAGAGIGALIDGLKKNHRTLYVRHRSVTLHLQTTPRQVVVGMRMRF